MLRGKVHRFGDDVSTDAHLSVKYRPPGTSMEALARDAFRELDPDFSRRVEPGDVIAAGENFGLVSSRQDAALVLRALGVSCVLAKSFGHMFYRNAINSGLPVIACDTDAMRAGEEILVDPLAGEARMGDERVAFAPFPAALWEMIEAGGLVPYLRAKGDF